MSNSSAGSQESDYLLSRHQAVNSDPLLLYPPTPKRSYVIVFLLLLLNLFANIDHGMIAGCIVELQQHFSISDSQSGLIETVFILVVTGSALIFGYLGDRWVRKLLIVYAFLIWAGAIIISTLIPSSYFYLFLLMRGVVSLGEAAVSTIGGDHEIFDFF